MLTLTRMERRKYDRMFKNFESPFNTTIEWCDKLQCYVAKNDYFVCSFDMDMYGNMENMLINVKTGQTLESEIIINEYNELNDYFVAPLQLELFNINEKVSILWK